MREGWTWDDLGRGFSWVDLRSFLYFPRPDSALRIVLEDPPVDPATVPTSDNLVDISERLHARRAELRDAESTRTAHRVKKKQ